MGCHTWAARKVNRSIGEARRLFLIENNKYISWWQEDIKKIKNGESTEPFEGRDIEYFQHLIDVCKRKERMVKKGLCNVAVMNNQPEHSYFIPGKGFYIDCDDFHDMFRVGHYPEDECFSLEETLDFIKKYEMKYNYKVEHCIFEGHDKTTLEEFWENYPDGYIHFG